MSTSLQKTPQEYASSVNMSRISKNLGWCSLPKTPAKAKLQLFFFQTPQNSQPHPPNQPTNQPTNQRTKWHRFGRSWKSGIDSKTNVAVPWIKEDGNGSKSSEMRSRWKIPYVKIRDFCFAWIYHMSYVWRIFNCFLCFNSCSKDLLLYGFLVEYVEVEVEMDSISDFSFWAPLVPIAHEIIAMMLTMMVATMNAEMMVPNV